MEERYDRGITKDVGENTVEVQPEAPRLRVHHLSIETIKTLFC